jgi:hypothetical protein|tara:strand:+ start:446 stop:772 length:327 start_codon:yes stop_codon:yes gene_type:complete
MSKFFDSNIIQESIQEIHELQKEVYKNGLNIRDMESEDFQNHIENLELLLDKQKIMYTRLSLSDDPDAIEMIKNLRKSVKIMGFPEGTDMNILFSAMEDTIEKMKNNC